MKWTNRIFFKKKESGETGRWQRVSLTCVASPRIVQNESLNKYTELTAECVTEHSTHTHRIQSFSEKSTATCVYYHSILWHDCVIVVFVFILDHRTDSEFFSIGFKLCWNSHEVNHLKITIRWALGLSHLDAAMFLMIQKFQHERSVLK